MSQDQQHTMRQGRSHTEGAGLSRRSRVSLAAVGAFSLAAMVSSVAGQAQSMEPAVPAQSVATAKPDLDDGTRKKITEFVIRYDRENPGHPLAEEVLDAEVELVETPDGYIAPRADLPANVKVRLADVPGLSNQWFFDSALAQIAPAVVRRMQTLGLIGVFVIPDQSQIDVVDGVVVDKRPEGVTSLTLQVTTGVVTSLRTVGLGERLPEDQTVDNAIHQRIKDRSPVYPTVEGKPQHDLLQRDAIDDYVFRLNRHPGRRVDVAVAADGTEQGGVAMDYVVTENRPWMLFAQLSNTGTISSRANLRERFGFVHNQLTNNDDTFSVDYLTGNFEDPHAVTTSYEAPVFGSDRVRWKIFGSWYTYESGEVGLSGLDFEGDGWAVGAEIKANFYQDRDLFLDVVGGARWENINVDNKTLSISADTNLFIPYAGLRLERVRQAEQTYASVIGEFNVPGISGTDDDDLNPLGRIDADDSWFTMNYDISHSFYLEPLFSKKNEASALANEISMYLRGQWTPDARLIPNAQGVIGGLYSVRGYPEALVAGDSTIVGTLEYRYHIPHGMAPSGKPGEFFGTPFRWVPQYTFGPVDWDLIAKVFVDAGAIFNNNTFDFEDESVTLVSAGVGLELALTRRFNARVDVGFPLKDYDDPAGNDSDVDVGDYEIHFVLTVVF